MEKLNFSHPFQFESRQILCSNKFAILASVTGHFENCFSQSYFTIDFICGADTVVFYFNKYDLAFKFYKKYSKRYHSYDFIMKRFDVNHYCKTVFKLLYDDSINKLRFEQPNRQKVIDYFASCCSTDFKLVPNGENVYALVPIEKSRE